MWESFVVAERMKLHRYGDNETSQYFWRTTQQQEIDLIEEKGSSLTAYGLKWNKNKKVRFPQTFTENYPGSGTFVILPDNIEDYLLI